MLFESSKTLSNYPCSHRRHKHDGHCAHIHGYSRSFTFWFRCNERTGNGFVLDFGHLKDVKAWLTENFDHTLLLDSDDPLIPEFQKLESAGACRLVIFEDVGMEGTAQHVMMWVGNWVQKKTNGRVWLHSVEVRENDKNSARVTLTDGFT